MQEQYRQTGGARLSKLLLAGAAAGAVSRTATAPIDRLKMLLQVQDDCKRGLTLREGIAKMSAEGSVKSYFRGNGANVLKIAPETAIKLALNDQLKLAIAHNSDNIQPLERMVAGGLAGAVAQFLLYPLDTIRTRLAVSSRGTYTGIMHVAARIRADEGLAAFYRGLTPSMIGILPYAGVDIALFEILKQTLFERAEAEGRPPPHFTLLVAGMVSSSIAQVVSYPLALIRTRLQAQGGAGKPVKYSGMMDVVQKTLAKEGVQGLYKGLVPNILKLAPAAGLSWWVFEETKLALGMDPRS
ncbi:mitochondrial substrate carrier [Haematococcus lacustris]